ncbi:MAG: hypothetical protein JO092_10535 [Candidatus Eremiobacteraeota bacterium]|nr:hypothetical protein [Candidatus Eremiobacteraeota bacterium]
MKKSEGGAPLASATLLTLLVVATSGLQSAAAVPSVTDLDAAARAAGNRTDIATTIGKSIFSTNWSAQISQVSANAVGTHLIVGIRLWGVKFHHPMTRKQFVAEVASLVERAFAAAPDTEEVDVWASVPIAVGKGVIVSGDLAKPTTRTVFSLSIRRGEPAAKIVVRATAAEDGAFWDPDWERAAFR